MNNTKTLNIGFDAKRALLNRSGLGNYSRDIIRNLHKFFPQHNYCLFSTGFSPELLEEKYRKNLFLPKGWGKFLKPVWRSYAITKLLNKNDIDVYHGLSNELPFNISKFKKAKVVSIHDLIFLKLPELYKPLDRFFYEKKTRYACLHADKIIAISHQTKNDIIDFYNIDEKRISVLYQSCNPIFYKKVSVEEKESVRQKYGLPKEFLLNVGTIEARKNVLSVVKAMQIAQTTIPLVIIGKSTPYLSEVNSFAAHHKMEGKIFALHNVPNEDLPALYQSSSMFIYPSLYEGFGIPILEAFNSGIPVITTNYGSTAEVSGDASLLIEPTNTEALAEAIEKLLTDKEMAEKYVEKGLQRALKFRQEVVSKELFDLYQSLL